MEIIADPSYEPSTSSSLLTISAFTNYVTIHYKKQSHFICNYQIKKKLFDLNKEIVQHSKKSIKNCSRH